MMDVFMLVYGSVMQVYRGDCNDIFEGLKLGSNSVLHNMLIDALI